MKAWIVTWEAASKNAERRIPRKIAAILHPNKSVKQVCQIVELIYSYETSTPEEMLLYAHRPSRNPNRAEATMYGGWVQCGHNPYLEARPATNVRVEREPNQEPSVRWDELQTPAKLKADFDQRFGRKKQPAEKSD